MKKKVKLSSLVLDFSLSVFDDFKDIYYLNDNYCEEITEWSKVIFIKFCHYIKSIKASKNQSKEKLVALYRYWLRKGLDENLLVKM